jgi:hypothetical protein
MEDVCKAKTVLVPYRKLNCIYSIYKHLAGNTSGKFKVLGIHFNLYKEDKVF